MTSTRVNEIVSNAYDISKSVNSDINNDIKNSQIYGLDTTEDVNIEIGCKNVNMPHPIANISVNIHNIEPCAQDSHIPITYSQTSDVIFTNNVIESSSDTFMPISDNIPKNDLDNPHSILNNLRISNMNRIMFAHININSVRNKCGMLADMIGGRVDILLVSETKIDTTFPSSQFNIPGYATPFRADRKENGANGGGMLLYLREDIPCKIVYNKETHSDIECFFVEINLYKKKWLIGCTYNPSKDLISKHIKSLSKYIDEHLKLYDNIIIMGDFNAEPIDSEMKEFCELYCLKNLVKDPTCYKNPDKPSCIDLVLTNRERLFQKTTVVETGLSDFHKMTVTILKTFFRKAPPKIVSYRDYKHFSQVHFRSELHQYLTNYNIYELSNDEFVKIFMGIFDKHAPLKQKYVRANQGPFMTKELRKAVMTRSKLRNKFNKSNTKSAECAYKKQRNLCTYLFRKAKRDYYSSLNPSNVTDNKKFWKLIKPLFSDKFLSNETITLVEGSEIIQDNTKVSEAFNDFFSNAVTNLNIEVPTEFLNTSVATTDPVQNAILRYKDHPSIMKIKGKYGDRDNFCFNHVSMTDVETEIMLLNSSKACPKDTIPPNIIKDNSDILTCKLLSDFNKSIDSTIFPINLKNADITPAHKKGDRTDKCNYRPVSILPTISKIFERFLYNQISIYMEPKLSEKSLWV